MRKYLFFFFLLGFFIPFLSFGAEYKQLNHDYYGDGVNGSVGNQQILGSGLEGMLTEIRVYAKASSNSELRVEVYCSVTVDMLTPCPSFVSATSTVQIDSSIGGVFVYENFFTTIEFNSLYYYAIGFLRSSGSALIPMAGSIDNNSYVNGRCNGGARCPNSVVDSGDIYFELYTNGGGDYSETKIISITPYDRQVVSSTSPVSIGYHVYVNSEQASSTVKFEVRKLNDPGGAIAPVYATSTIVGNVGDLYFSDFYPSLIGLAQQGTYEIDLTIRPITIFGFMEPYTVATTTYFAVGANSQYGAQLVASQSAQREFFEQIATSTPSNYILPNYCNFVGAIGKAVSFGLLTYDDGWDFGKCLQLLVTGTPSDWQRVASSTTNGFLSVWPVGYVTRFVSLVSTTTASSSLPYINVTIPANFMGTHYGGGNTLSLSPWQVFQGNSILNTVTSSTTGQNGLTFLGIITPYWNMANYFVFFFAVVAEFIGIVSIGGSLTSGKTQEGVAYDNEGRAYAYGGKRKFRLRSNLRI